jgi:phage anti-repressor protein
MRAKTEEGKTLYHRSTTRAEVDQNNIYKALEMTPQFSKQEKRSCKSRCSIESQNFIAVSRVKRGELGLMMN